MYILDRNLHQWVNVIKFRFSDEVFQPDNLPHSTLLYQTEEKRHQGLNSLQSRNDRHI